VAAEIDHLRSEKKPHGTTTMSMTTRRVLQSATTGLGLLAMPALVTRTLAGTADVAPPAWR
jgi:hypothetical protein